MIITFMRQDQSGNLVKVEISKNDQTGAFIRIRRETISVKHNNIRLRSDAYWSKEPEAFKHGLEEEIKFQEELLDTLKNLLKIT